MLIVDKHAGATSHDIVGIVRRAYSTRRVGHTGTLDPMATGVLVVLVGRAAKASEYLVCERKSYLATLRLGITTDTEDTTGKILTVSGDIPPPEAVIAAAASFAGQIMQIPPMYSALKVGGRKLYEIAREGGIIEREGRPVEIYRLNCAPCQSSSAPEEPDGKKTPARNRPTDYTLELDCSAGTYVRTLCADIGSALGCGGAMASLRRTRAGGFGLADAVSAGTLEAMSPAEREALLLPVESLFADLPAVRLPAFYERLCRSGCEIYLSKIGLSYPAGKRLRLLGDDGRFFALGEVRSYPAGEAAKAIKTFEL